MRLLAIETTDLRGSIAVWDDMLLVAKELEPQDVRSAQSLAPTIHSVLKELGWKARELEAVAVAVGPGSFTGLRIGVVTAKGLAYATGAKLVGVDTLLSLAYPLTRFAPGKVVEVGVDAQRFDACMARFQLPESEGLLPIRLTPNRIIPIKEWFSGENIEDVESLICTPLLERYPAELADPVRCRLVPQDYWHPTAVAVGAVGRLRLLAGESDDWNSLLPVYSRKSAAEEKKDGCNNG